MLSYLEKDDLGLFSACYTRLSLREGAQRPLTDSKAPTYHSLPEFFTLSSRGHHVQQNPHAFVSRILWALAPFTLLAFGAATTIAQHTEVRNNGVGGKIELDYNAAGKVTEMRTIGADGKVQQKVDYEYLPGYYGAQQTRYDVLAQRQGPPDSTQHLRRELELHRRVHPGIRRVRQAR